MNFVAIIGVILTFPLAVIVPLVLLCLYIFCLNGAGDLSFRHLRILNLDSPGVLSSPFQDVKNMISELCDYFSFFLLCFNVGLGFQVFWSYGFLTLREETYRIYPFEDIRFILPVLCSWSNIFFLVVKPLCHPQISICGFICATTSCVSFYWDIYQNHLLLFNVHNVYWFEFQVWWGRSVTLTFLIIHNVSRLYDSFWLRRRPWYNYTASILVILCVAPILADVQRSNVINFHRTSWAVHLSSQFIVFFLFFELDDWSRRTLTMIKGSHYFYD